jgi:hypothetical protein
MLTCTLKCTIVAWCLLLLCHAVAFQPHPPLRLGTHVGGTRGYHGQCSVACAALGTKLTTLNAELWDKEITACSKPLLAFFSAPCEIVPN